MSNENEACQENTTVDEEMKKDESQGEPCSSENPVIEEPESFSQAVLDEIFSSEEFLEQLKKTVLGQLQSSFGEEAEAPEGIPTPITGVFKGPFDFEQLELTTMLKALSVKALAETIPSKREACRIIEVLVSWFNYRTTEVLGLFSRLSELDARYKLLEEQIARTREVTMGQKSERRSTIDKELAEDLKKEEEEIVPVDTSEDKKDADANDNDALTPIVNDEKDAVQGQQAPDEKDAAQGQQAPDEKDAVQGQQAPDEKDAAQGQQAPDEKDAAQGQQAPDEKDAAQGQQAPDEKDAVQGQQTTDEKDNEENHPKRQKGCGIDRIIKNAIHIPYHKAYTEEELAELEAKGELKKLPDGSYTTIVMATIPVVVEVTFDRYQNIETKEIYAADSADSEESGHLQRRSPLTKSILTRFLFQRVVQGIPVPRILKEFETAGFAFSKQVFYSWFIQYAMAMARPLVHRMLTKILESGKVQSDETWVKVREDLTKNKRKNSVLWLIRTSERLSIPPMVVLQYTGSRASKEFADIIRGYSLKLMSDGYSGYSALLKEFADTMELVGCLQHARSKFIDVIQALKGKTEYKNLSREERKALPVNRILDAFGKVFKLESQMDSKASTREEKLKYRQEVVRVEWDEMYKIIESENAKLRPSDKGYMADAIRYSIKFKDRFLEALNDPDMPLHNSACERVFARFSSLRRNFLQIDTIYGTESMCYWFSVIRTAQENGVNEQIYIQFLVERLKPLLEKHGDYHFMSVKSIKEKGMDGLPQFTDLEYLDVLLPWSKEFQEYVKAYPKKKLEQVSKLAEILAKAKPKMAA